MEEKTLNALYALKEAMKVDPRFVIMKDKEAKMMEDEEVQRLSIIKKEKEEEYESSLSRFGENSELSKAKQKQLYLAKLELDSNPLVKEYSKSYIEVRDIVNKIDDLLFYEYRNHGGCKK